jgi:hypothetical protein
MILINVSDELNIPFYISSWDWNKPWVPTGKFYPIFWIKDRRLNKGTESEINNYYGSPLLAAIAKELDKRNKENKIDISDRNFSDSEFEEKINKWKNPVSDGEWAYNNINEVLKKISKIKETD